MTAYSGGEPHDIFGRALDPQPVSPQFAHLFPDLARQAPGGQMQPRTTVVEPAPSKPGKKRPKRRTVPQPTKPKPYKTPKSTPGGQQMPQRKGSK